MAYFGLTDDKMVGEAIKFVADVKLEGLDSSRSSRAQVHAPCRTLHGAGRAAGRACSTR